MKKSFNVRKRNKSFIFNKIFLICFILFLAILIIFFTRSDFFKIRKIEIKSERINCTDKTGLINTANLLGQNFLFVNFENISKNLKEKFICIKNVNVSRLLPGRIKLEINGREPVAVLILLKIKEASTAAFLENIATPSTEESNDLFIVDKEGIIFSKEPNGTQEPRIYFYNQNLSLGQKLNDDFINEILKILNKVKTFRIDLKETIIFNDLFIIIQPSAGAKIIFRLDTSVDIQLASLQLILQQAKIEDKELELIDLRFDKPIIKFAPKK